MLWWTLALSLLPLLICLHLHIAPYSKVEESFNIQAVHDILTFGIPVKDVGNQLKIQYDHMTFPGAVPRTFIGALVLAGLSKPVLWMNNVLDRQQLGQCLDPFISHTSIVPCLFPSLPLLIASQSVLYSACSMLLPLLHMHKASERHSGRRLACGTSLCKRVSFTSCSMPLELSRICLHSESVCIIQPSSTSSFTHELMSGTFALSYQVPDPATTPPTQLKRSRLAIYLLTVATVIFRSELALLVASHGFYLLFSQAGETLQSRILFIRKVLLPAGIWGALLGLALTIPIDTFFWQSPTPLWPELSAFLSNIFPTNDDLGASAWGTSPWHWYFTSALPRLFLNPLTLFLIPYSLTQPGTRAYSLALLIPNITYILLYSILQHKETRFLFPILPPLTTAAALAATHISNRHNRTTTYRLATYALILSTAITFIISHAILLPLSALSYPGAFALNALHSHASAHQPNSQSTISVHLNNLALQTGVTRFLQIPHPVKDLARSSTSTTASAAGSSSTRWIYDKSDKATDLLSSFFWFQFDYAVVESPALAIGSWEVVDTIYGLGKPRMLRPDEDREPTKVLTGLGAVLERLYGRSLAVGYENIRDLGRTWTGGWWVDVGYVEKLYVLKRGRGVELVGGEA